jgi:predicted ATPase
MYVSDVEIRDLKCFKTAYLRFVHPGSNAPTWHKNVTLLLGANGTGKTTVLQAVALAALNVLISGQNGFKPCETIRRDRRRRNEAAIDLNLRLHGIEAGRDDEDLTGQSVQRRITIIRDGDHETLVPSEGANNRTSLLERSPSFFVVGYGSQRTLISARQNDLDTVRGARSVRYHRIAGLFEDNIQLVSMSSWLLPSKLGKSRYREVVGLINRLLPSDVRFRGGKRRGELLFAYRGVEVLASGLSDGYRAYLGWITDLLYHLSVVCASGRRLTDLTGVVLVDEVDLHLHPAWQRLIISRLSAELPNLQFILTTHSPIVAGSVSSRNIYIMEVEPDGTATARQLTEVIHGRNADQILLSRYFQLPTTRAPGFMDELRQLSARARDGDVRAAMMMMEKLTTGSEPDVEATRAPGRNARASGRR